MQMPAWWTVNHWIALSTVATAIATFLIWWTNRRYTRATELIQRPRVEVFTELCERRDPKSAYSSRIRVANLSPVGIWLDQIDVEFGEPKPRTSGAHASVEINRVLGPFSEIEIVPHEQMVKAYPGVPDPSDVRRGVLKFTLKYRVHNEWFRTPVRQYEVEFTLWELRDFKELAARTERTQHHS